MKKRLNIFLLAFPLCPVFQIQAQEKPNLVFIMADQWRGDALGCLGKEILTTTMVQLLGTNGVQKNAGTVLTIGPLMALTTTI